MANIMLEAALNYAQMGFAVLPLYPVRNGTCACAGGCGKPGKHPRIIGWQDNATTNADVVRQWWTRWPESGIGVLTGCKSGVFVVDVDGPQGEASIAAWETKNGDKLVTRTVITSKVVTCTSKPRRSG